jgi:hypothetical protein
MIVCVVLCSCKKQKQQPEESVPVVEEYKPAVVKYLQKTRRVDSAQFAGQKHIVLTNYAYTGAVLSSYAEIDSTFGGSIWSTSTTNVTYGYTGPNRTTMTQTENGTVTTSYQYIYDTDGKLSGQFLNYWGNLDSTTFVHSGNKSIGTQKKVGNTYKVVKYYYTDGDLDSAVVYINGNAEYKCIDTYHPSNISKTLNEQRSVTPLGPAGKELLSYTIAYPVSSETETYSYSKDNDGYYLTKRATSPQVTYTLTYFY